MSEAGPLDEGGILAPRPSRALEPLDAPPTFSVVIAAYEAAGTIGEAVRSALAQSHAAREVIVVDDGSSDDLRTALLPFGDDVTLLRQDNAGAASARNTGVGAASGDFVAFLDADDRFHPRRIESLAALARRRPDLDLLSTDMRFVIDGREVGRFFSANAFATVDQRGAILRSCFVGAPPAVRACRLLEAGGFDERLAVAEDWDCWLRLILGGSLAGIVDLPYYDYVLRPGTLTASRVASLWGRVRMLEKAEANPALRPSERGLVREEIRRRRSEAVLATAGSAAAGSRRRYAGLALSRRLRGTARLAAMLAFLSPRLARGLLRGRDAPAARLSPNGR